MKISTSEGRLLSIEVRASCFGYATFQGSNQLLDYGASSPYPLHGASGRAKKRLASVLSMLPPDLIVLKRPRGRVARHPLYRSLRQEAARRSIPVVIVTLEDVRRGFSIFRAGNKG